MIVSTHTEGRMHPPWTLDEVTALNAYQRDGWGHPFTCPLDRTVLVAYEGGWECRACGYEQDWAWRDMASGRRAM